MRVLAIALSILVFLLSWLVWILVEDVAFLQNLIPTYECQGECSCEKIPSLHIRRNDV